MSIREQFEARGELGPSSNPPHRFRVGRLLVQWQVAKDCWAVLDDKGVLHNYWLHLGSLETIDGLKGWKLVLWRFALLLGWKGEN